MNIKRRNPLFLATLILGKFIGAQTESMAEKNLLSNYQWNNRILIVFAPDNGDPSFLRQISEITSHQAGVADRDMVVIDVIGDQRVRVNGKNQFRIRAQALRAGFGVAAQQFRTILVGKDGGEKLRASSFIPMAEIFSTIDAMPMRQSEMMERSVSQ